MKMNRTFITLIILLIFGQLSSSQDHVSMKTFEGHVMKYKEMMTKLPLLQELNRDLSSLYGSADMMDFLFTPEEELKEEISANSKISSECKTSLFFALKHPNINWTINMLDATAKPPPAIRYGALNWIGNFEMCMSNPPPKSYAPFGVPPKSHYCRIKFGGTPSTTIIDLTPKINVGFCVPETCSSHDIYEVIQAIVKAASSVLPNSTIPSPLKHDNVYCYVRQEDMKFNTGAIVMLVISSIFGLLLIIGTTYDLAVAYRRDQPITSQPINTEHSGNYENRIPFEENFMNMGGVSPNNRYEHIEEANEKDKSESLPPTVVAQHPPLRRWEKAVVAFSVYNNAKKILDTKQQPGRLNCLDGIRFLSMSWVILGHTYFFAYTSVNNLVPFLKVVTTRWTYEAIFNATFSVDSFFLLSGLLTSHLFLKEANKMGTVNNVKFWILYFLHRFWRLTPPYMLFLGFYTALYRYMSNGPLYNQKYGVDEMFCRDNWWINLLYLNNIVKSKKMCMGWTWYLANDMQFHYFVAPGILILMFLTIRYPHRILYCILNCIACTVVITASLIYVGVISKLNSFMPGDFRGFDLMYVKPWCRVSPYIVGLLTGYLILEHQKRNWRLHPAVVGVGWILATATGLAVIYGLSGVNDGSYKIGVDASALYNSVSRFAWSVALAWLIYACLTGNGGWINSFLSWPAFIPLSRLTYCAYLVHPVVIILYYQSLESVPVVNTITTVYWFFGHMTAAYMVAFVLSLSCESPLIGLERILLKKQ